ncbi:MAG: trigger factor, partial [Nitrospirae bacterium]|nr:trigger factor [Nitrospirota bacterium]
GSLKPNKREVFMKVEVEKRSETVRAFHIEVPSDVVSKEFEGVLSDTQRRAKVPGFRPGRVPRNVIEQKYGKDIESDVIQKLIPDFYMKAVKESGLTPVEMPQIEKMDLKKGAPLTFTAVVEVKPDLGKLEWEGLELSEETSDVTEEEISQTLKHLQDRFSQLEAYPEDHPVEKDDFVQMDYEGFDEEGQPLPSSKSTGVLIQIGSGRLVPGFEEGLLGGKKGEHREVHVTFPEDYHAKEMAGRKVVFKVKVGEIKNKITPELDYEFAQGVGEEYNSLDALKDKIRKELAEHKEEDQKARQREAAVSFLIEKNPVTPPQSLVAKELERLLVKALSLYGKNADKLTDDEKKQMVAEYTPVSERHVKAALLLEALAAKENVEVSDADVDAEVEKIAQKAKETPEKVKQYLVSTEGSLKGLKSQIMERKTIDRILSKAHVKEATTG